MAVRHPTQFPLVCLGLALGCTAKSPVPVEELTVIPAGALVVLTGDPIVYREREDPVGVLLPERSHSSYAVEVITATATRIQVRTLGHVDEPLTCASKFEFADDYELRFWVDKKDLRQVLVAPAIFASTDGTKLELRPGVPVIDEASGELGIEGLSLFVALADAELGLAYQPERVEFEGGHHSLRSGTPLHYGDQGVVGVVPPLGHASDVIEMKDSTEGELLLGFDNACGRFTLRAPASALTPEDAIPQMARNFDPDMVARQVEILGVTAHDHSADSPYASIEPQCTPPRWTIASGVAVSWANGSPAGTVRRAQQWLEDAREVGDQVCFQVDVFRLCAEASKLGRELDPDCATAN